MKRMKTEIRFNAGVRWIGTETERLIKLYPITANHELAEKFDRPIWGIKGKARALGLKKNYGQRPFSCSRWSTEETVLLSELFPAYTNEAVAEKLDRSIDSIVMKARKMGLRKSEFWSDQEDDLLKCLYKRIPYDRLAEKLKRTKSAVKARIIVLGLECKVKDWTNAEDDYLRRNYLRKSYKKISDELGRTYCAVSQRTRRIGLVNKQSIKSNS
jgi:hypothetical protein